MNRTAAPVMYCALDDVALIAVAGPDALPFLHGQLTSDVIATPPLRTHYAGYCSPKGRLLATFLLWRMDNEVLLQLPASLAEAIRARLQKFVLRSKVTLENASGRFRIYGIAGNEEGMASLANAPPAPHGVAVGNGLIVTRLSSRRCIALEESHGRGIQDLAATPMSAAEWSRSEIESGIPWISPATQDQFVPQMVNLDLLDGVSFSKGCYPGQEIVARMHYLGRLKQRMYRVRFSAADTPHAGDSLFSPRFGVEQSCGALLDVVSAGADAYDALAVMQIDSARDRDVHWTRPDGPLMDFRPLPYSVPE